MATIPRTSWFAYIISKNASGMQVESLYIVPHRTFFHRVVGYMLLYGWYIVVFVFFHRPLPYIFVLGGLCYATNDVGWLNLY